MSHIDFEEVPDIIIQNATSYSIPEIGVGFTDIFLMLGAIICFTKFVKSLR
jgi:hypothetical protein